ncbi:hypothetical protein CVT26_016085 [Gymnopilus dilepis]|uniref:Zinc finger PHD-type domain-containing protein n=1 Tax=Gymnopilus dilepis TaxID=231916 RepID=A0A409YDZ7_9AGAR|nr:hypothetical protein CVT26_016085 [Gymnopilus dilepis]
MATESTLSEYLSSQEELVKEAALALPHQFSKCTYSLGYLRFEILQGPPFLVINLPKDRLRISVLHVQRLEEYALLVLSLAIPIMNKLNFSIAHSCALHPKLEEENANNQYGQNFKGIFCRCGRSYDPKSERETMIQCLACEDWFHESCCNLRERPSSRENSPEVQPVQPMVDHSTGNELGEDAASDTSTSGLPPPLISGDEYESFVCGACVSRNPTLMKWAGTPGAIMVVRDTPADRWRRLEVSSQTGEEVVQVDDDPQDVSMLGTKRPSSPSALDEPKAKRPKNVRDGEPVSSFTCLAPAQDPLAQKIMSASNKWEPETSLGTGDIFFTLGFRDRWCHCDSCLPHLKANPYLLEDEETYEPPEDPDSGLSLEELGMRALARLPRDKAIDGIHAFNEMRNNLVSFLRPFAQEGKVVNESDVREFFASLTQGAKKAPE